jgi:hypothetical protein
VAKANEESKFTKNYATDARTVDRFMDEVKGTILQARQNRRAKEERWLDDLSSWACVESEGQQYQGRANIIVPELHHQVESSVSKYLSALFPNDEYMGTVPLKHTVDSRAKKIQAAVYHELEHKNKIRVLFDIHGRQRKLFGTAPLRASFVDQQVKIFTKDEKGKVSPSIVPRFNGVRWVPVDIFRWYICPEWATMDDYFLMFEDDFVSIELLKSAKNADGKKLYENLDDIADMSKEADEHWWVDTQRLSTCDITTALDQRKGQVFVTYVHMDFDIEGSGERVPCYAVIANSGTVHALGAEPAVAYSVPHTLLVATSSTRHGTSTVSLFHNGSGHWTSSMRDLANQTMDSINYSLNPIAIIDPALAGDPGSFVLQPGAKWWGSPQGIQFAQFPDVSGWVPGHVPSAADDRSVLRSVDSSRSAATG